MENARIDSELYLFTPIGMGDILICYGFIKELSKKYIKIYYYVTENNYDNAIRLFKSIHNVEIIKAQIVNNRVIVDPTTLTVGWEYFAEAVKSNPNLHCDKFCYDFVSVPLEKKWDNFYLERNLEKEKEVFYDILQLKDDEEFFFIHESIDKGIINRKYLKENIKLINPCDYTQISLFDFLYTIEKSKEIHVVNSSFRTLIDIMNINHNSLNYHRYVKGTYLRELECSQPTCRLNWNIFYE